MKVRRISNMMKIKLVTGGVTLNIINALRALGELGHEVKKQFWRIWMR